MTNSNTLSLSGIIQKVQIKETILMLSVSVLLPFIIHFIPAFGNVPAGAVLLPMFYAPLIALIFFRAHVGFLTALLAPTINYLITGNPLYSLIAPITIELTAFVLLFNFISKVKYFKIASAPIAYILSKISILVLVSAFPLILKTSGTAFFQSLLNAIPGIVTLLIINLSLIELKKKF